MRPEERCVTLEMLQRQPKACSDSIIWFKKASFPTNKMSLALLYTMCPEERWIEWLKENKPELFEEFAVDDIVVNQFGQVGRIEGINSSDKGCRVIWNKIGSNLVRWMPSCGLLHPYQWKEKNPPKYKIGDIVSFKYTPDKKIEGKIEDIRTDCTKKLIIYDYILKDKAGFTYKIEEPDIIENNNFGFNIGDYVLFKKDLHTFSEGKIVSSRLSHESDPIYIIEVSPNGPSYEIKESYIIKSLVEKHEVDESHFGVYNIGDIVNVKNGIEFSKGEIIGWRHKEYKVKCKCGHVGFFAPEHVSIDSPKKFRVGDRVINFTGKIIGIINDIVENTHYRYKVVSTDGNIFHFRGGDISLCYLEETPKFFAIDSVERKYDNGIIDRGIVIKVEAIPDKYLYTIKLHSGDMIRVSDYKLSLCKRGSSGQEEKEIPVEKKDFDIGDIIETCDKRHIGKIICITKTEKETIYKIEEECNHRFDIYPKQTPVKLAKEIIFNVGDRVITIEKGQGTVVEVNPIKTGNYIYTIDWDTYLSNELREWWKLKKCGEVNKPVEDDIKKYQKDDESFIFKNDKIKMFIIKHDKCVLIRILEMDERFINKIDSPPYKSFSSSKNQFEIKSMAQPDMLGNAIYLRGSMMSADNNWMINTLFTSNQKRDEYVENLKIALHEWAENWQGFKK